MKAIVRASPTAFAPSVFVVSLIMLVLIGVFFVFDASVVESIQVYQHPYFIFSQHVLGILVGICLFVGALLIPSRWWQKTALIWYGLGLMLLSMVFIPGLGVMANGARRWVDLGPLTIQPVEMVKLGLVLWLSVILTKKLRTFPWLIYTAIPCGLVLLQPDVGSALVLLAIAVSMFVQAGGPSRRLWQLSLLAIPLFAILLMVAPYRFQRLTSFINPDSDPLGSSFHIRQLILAVGRGGLLGQGLGNSSQKYRYVPEAGTDSIFAIIGEELGFMGAVTVLGLFVLLVGSGERMIRECSPPGRLFGLGLLFWIASQVTVNLAAILALIPLTGIPLPFISYGRSSMLMLLLVAGMLYRLHRESVAVRKRP